MKLADVTDLTSLIHTHNTQYIARRASTLTDQYLINEYSDIE